MAGRRQRSERHFIDLPMTLSSLRGKVLDRAAVIRDLTPSGFGFETVHAFHRGERLAFEVDLGSSERVRGEAEIRWVRTGDWGTWVGARITRLSWRDARKIKRKILLPVYDWKGLGDRALTAAFIVALALLVQELLR